MSLHSGVTANVGSIFELEADSQPNQAAVL